VVNPAAIVARDLDGDGVMDLATVGNSGVSTFINRRRD
jgi:hypothetical protein